MIECICTDAKDKPSQIPLNKWLKEQEPYTVIYSCTAMPQKILAFQLAEIDLGEESKPYEYFSAKRFGFTEENLLKLKDLIKQSEDIDFSIKELMEQTQTAEVC